MAAHPLGTAALDLAKNNLYFKFQHHTKKLPRNVYTPNVRYSLENRSYITDSYIDRITGCKGSCSLYECNKSKGRCSHVSWKQVINSRTGNQTASWKIPTTGCMQILCHAAMLHPLVSQPCTLIKTDNHLQILRG